MSYRGGGREVRESTGGFLACDCETFRAALTRMKFQSQIKEAPWCRHLANVVLNEADRGFLNVLDNWDKHAVIYFPKTVRLMASAIVSIPLVDEAEHGDLHAVSLLGEPDNVLGFVHGGTAARKDIAMIVAPELVVQGLEGECQRCHNNLTELIPDFDVTNKDHRAEALQRGAFLHAHEWVCAHCTEEDLIPNV